MNPDKCNYCKNLVGPFDPDYVVWDGHRWHVDCALAWILQRVKWLKSKQQKMTVTAGVFADLQAEIDDLEVDYQNMRKVEAGVELQSQQLAEVFMDNAGLVKRDGDGRLLPGEHEAGARLGGKVLPCLK